jgi:hypothetical protein
MSGEPCQEGGMMLTFHEYKRRWPDFPGHMLLEACTSLSQCEQDACWSDLAEWCRGRVDDEHSYERALHGYEEPPKPKRQPTGTTATTGGTVAYRSGDDPLQEIEPAIYVSDLLGVDVVPGGKVACPFHDDRAPSLHVYRTAERGWCCHGCHRGGDIYTFAAELAGIEPRGPEFVALAKT